MIREERIAAISVIWPLLLFSVVPSATVPAIREQQWHLEFLRVAQAQQISRGAGVTVAVIDSGVDASHPDLKGSVVPGIDLTVPPDSLDGRLDNLGHGTGMAGLIVAHGQALGIAPQAKILPIRMSDISLNNAPLAVGVDWAVAHGATVINISLTYDSASGNDRDAIDRALANNIVVVAAAGNSPDTSVGYPAAYAGVVAVVGVDKLGNHAAVSVTGPEAVIAAPAVDIVSTDIGHGYRVADGTSDATAIVSGVAALIRSKYPTMSAAEVVHRLEATADDRGPPGRDDQYGYGIVDPVKALTADIPPLTPGITPTPPSPIGATPTTTSTHWTPIILIGLAILAALAAVGGVVLQRRRSPLE